MLIHTSSSTLTVDIILKESEILQTVFKSSQSENGYGIGNFIGSFAKGAARFLKTVGELLSESVIGLASDRRLCRCRGYYC